MSETLSTVSKLKSSVINAWKDLTTPACENPNLIIPGFGTKLEVWNCDDGAFVTVAAGQEVELPKRTLGLIETTGAVPENFNAKNGFIYDEFQPGIRASLESVAYMCQMTERNYDVWSAYFGIKATYRIVAANAIETYWAFNAIMFEDQVKFPNGAEDSANYEVNLQPSGFFVYGHLKAAE